MRSQDGQGFPRIERDILQVEELSRQLKAKHTRLDGSQDALAASRLLAQEGLNAQRCGIMRAAHPPTPPHSLTAATNALELQATYEDVFEPRSADLEEYLQQVLRGTGTTPYARSTPRYTR